MNNDFLPIILGSDENAYGMARLFFDKYNIKPLLLCSKQLVCTMHSKILDVCVFPDFDKEEIFIKSLLEIASKKKKEYKKLVIIPCSDGYSLLCVKHQENLKNIFVNSFISKEMFDQFSTKDMFYKLCDDYNLNYPKTVICTKEERLNVFENSNLKFPVVVKANNSNSYSYLHCDFKGKSKVYFFDNIGEYLEVVNEMNKSDYDDNLIIQEFIPGDDTNMRVINCYSDKNGKVKFMAVGQPILEEYTPYAIGNYASIISIQNQELCDMIKSFLEKIGYVGFSNFDLKFDSRDNSYKLFEINPRQGRSSFFVASAGYNLAEIMINDLVYNQDNEIIIAKNTALWSTVPKAILKKYISNQEILKKVSALIKQKKLCFTLLYKKDFSIIRYAKIIKYYSRHFANYKKYYFKKDK
jgi:D-aspartate ligase